MAAPVSCQQPLVFLPSKEARVNPEQGPKREDLGDCAFPPESFKTPPQSPRSPQGKPTPERMKKSCVQSPKKQIHHRSQKC